jgi:parallel beta-helix repeat protein
MIPNRKSIIEMALGLLVIAGSVQADPTVITTCPFVITSPGDYVLAADLGCSGGGTGITITSSHVRLALERHTISGSPGTGISNSSDGVTGTPVTDVHILGPGRIQGFVSGISLVGSVTDSEVSGITVQRFTVGITANGQAFGTTGLRLTKNTLAGGTEGISVTNLTSSTISENVVSGCTVGIQIGNGGMTGGSPLMLSRNIVSGNPNTGVNISGGFVTVQNNVISGNGNDGINVVTASQFGPTIITNNTVSGNGTVGINVVVSQLGDTITLEIINNTVVATGTVDLNDTVPNCAGTVWSGNTFFTASQSCVH